MDEPLPIGMALRVPLPDSAKVAAPVQNYYYGATQQTVVQPASLEPDPGPDGLVDFDDLSLPMVCIK
jgi:ubiquitin-conjugating enzyme E2 Q